MKARSLRLSATHVFRDIQAAMVRLARRDWGHHFLADGRTSSTLQQLARCLIDEFAR